MILLVGRNVAQLWHGGHRWAPTTGQAPISASDVPCPLGLVNTPFTMTQDQIDEITEAYADAAFRAQQGGLDGVELHFGHGYLIHQFLCPLTNRREDDYGGSLENRMRFGRGILDAVRGRLSHRLTVRNQRVPKLGEFVPAGLHRDGVLSRRQSE